MIPNDKFFEIVMAALKARTEFSTVRMSDGEKKILEWTSNVNTGRNAVIDSHLFNAGWHERFGTAGITSGVIRDRLLEAFSKCTYFCPGAGVEKLFPPHPRELADKQHTYEWTRAQRKALLEEAESVIVINRDPRVSDLIFGNGKCAVWHLPLNNWKETTGIWASANQSKAPLVLLSGGPAAKYLAPAIAAQHGRMVLDIGQGADAWFMPTGIEHPSLTK